jgi:recombination protein RecA
MMEEEKAGLDEVLEVTIKQIKARWGDESIHVSGEDPLRDKGVISSGISQLDDILGNGGLARGSVVEVFGPEGSGKSTICLQIIKQAQEQGITCAFIDMEQVLNPDYASKLGVDIEKLIISQPDYMEAAFGVCDALVRTGKVGVIIIDSIASLVPKAEVDADVDKETMGLQPRKMSAFLRKVNPLVASTDTLLIFTNQLREKVGMVYGNPTTTPGGRAIRFYATYRLEVNIKERLEENGEYVGNKLKVTTVKNKRYMPYKVTYFNLRFGEGVDLLASSIDKAIEMGIITKKGTWLNFDGNVYQGVRRMKEALNESPELKVQFDTALAAVPPEE